MSASTSFSLPVSIPVTSSASFEKGDEHKREVESDRKKLPPVSSVDSLSSFVSFPGSASAPTDYTNTFRHTLSPVERSIWDKAKRDFALALRSGKNEMEKSRKSKEYKLCIGDASLYLSLQKSFEKIQSGSSTQDERVAPLHAIRLLKGCAEADRTSLRLLFGTVIGRASDSTQKKSEESRLEIETTFETQCKNSFAMLANHRFLELYLEDDLFCNYLKDHTPLQVRAAFTVLPQPTQNSLIDVYESMDISNAKSKEEFFRSLGTRTRVDAFYVALQSEHQIIKAALLPPPKA